MSLVSRKMINERFVVQGTANDLPSGTTAYEGMMYIVGATPTGAFASGGAKTIASYESGKWRFINPSALQLEVLDVSEAKIKRYNGTTWVDVYDFAASCTDIHEKHTITASEASNKKFDLANVVETGKEGDSVLFYEGVGQVYTTDYTITTASGKSTLSWNGMGLDSIGVDEGEHIVVYYKKKG